MWSLFARTALCALAIGLINVSASALDFGVDKSAGVTWTLVEQEVAGKPGDTVIVKVVGEIPKGWHTYSLKKYKLGPTSTKVTIEPKDAVSLVPESVSYDPKPYNEEAAAQAYGPENVGAGGVEAFENKVTLSLPIKIAETAAGDSIKVSITVVSAICDANNCKPKTSTDLPLVVMLKKKVSDARTYTPVPTTKPIQWMLADQDAQIKAAAGGRFILHVKGMIKNDYHTFATKQDPKLQFAAVTAFSVEPKEWVTVDGEAIADHAAEPTYDQTLGGDVLIYENAVEFNVPVRVNANAKDGVSKIKLLLKSQACREGVCVQVPAAFEAELAISGHAPAAAVATAPVTEDDAIQNALKSGWAAFLGLAALGGLISLLTPCVFPMIPITVSFFTKRQHVSHTRAVRDALIFSAGIVLTFVGLGFIMALVFGQSMRNLAANPWMNLGIFVVFMVMAFNLLGFYELQVPSFVLNALNKKANKGDSIYSLLLMGLVFSLTSFTCTGPFIGTVMVAAVDGNWFKPMVGMAVFATVFATPFFMLALFPTMLKTLPKSGGWLNSVKVVMGLIEIAAALKFLSSAELVWHWGILTHEVFVIIWILIMFATAAYVLGFIRFPHDTPLKKRSPLRYAFAAIFLTLAGLLVADLAGHPDSIGVMISYVPQRPYPPLLTDDWETGLAAARRSGKPVFFDFTGLTCVNCRRMEEGMFKRKDIEDLLKNFVVVRLYTDTQDNSLNERNSKVQLDRYKKETLPFYAIVSPEGKDIVTFPDGYTDDVKKFTEFLKVAISNQLTAQNE